MKTTTISCRWYRNRVSAVETMAVELPVSPATMIEAGQLEGAFAFRDVRLKDDGNVHLHACSTSQDDARQRIVRVVRALRFFGYAGLREATKAESEAMRLRLQDVPGKRCLSGAWIRVESGAWVFANATRDPVDRARVTWARENGVAYLPPGFENAWPPGPVPSLFCKDSETAEAMASSLGRLHGAGPVEWDGTSTPYVKPEKRKRVTGLTLAQHREVGTILADLCASRLPRLVAKAIRDARYELGEVLAAKHPREDCGATYYGHGRPLQPIADRTAQLAAVERAVDVLASAFDPRDGNLVSMRRARLRLSPG